MTCCNKYQVWTICNQNFNQISSRVSSTVSLTHRELPPKNGHKFLCWDSKIFKWQSQADYFDHGSIKTTRTLYYFREYQYRIRFRKIPILLHNTETALSWVVLYNANINKNYSCSFIIGSVLCVYGRQRITQFTGKFAFTNKPSMKVSN